MLLETGSGITKNTNMASKSPSPEADRERANTRRQDLGLGRAEFGNGEGSGRPWALCLSGGGIRSATFCLGVLQGLSRTPAPLVRWDDKPFVLGATNNLLAQFDFLSTVSGGGYIGSFFTSLFVPGRLDGTEEESADQKETAENAYRVLQEDPPQRMHTTTTYKAGVAALAWLRDNGRYLTPTGGGDMGYAAAIAIRNWFAVHFVIATMLLSVLSISLFLRLVAVQYPGFVALETIFNCGEDVLLWSSTWYVVAGVLVVLASPFGIAYWFAHPQGNAGLDEPSERYTYAWRFGVGFGFFCMALGQYVVWQKDAAPLWAKTLLVVGALAIGSCIFYVLTHALGKPNSVSGQRVLLSRILTRCLALAGAVSALALIETLALTAVHWLSDASTKAAVGVSAGSVMAAVVWVIRLVAGRRQAVVPSEARQSVVPLDALAAALAALLWSIVGCALGAILLWLYFDGNPHIHTNFSASSGYAALLLAAWGTLALVFIAALVGRFPGFINLSTLQPLYSARLTRAYLGASNNRRFADTRSEKAPATSTGAQVSNGAHSGSAAISKLKQPYEKLLVPIQWLTRAYLRVSNKEQKSNMSQKGSSTGALNGEPADETSRARLRNVAEPAPCDILKLTQLYKNRLAPIHFINVCLNQTAGPEGQLVQRDRKGKPLVISEDGFYVDGEPHSFHASGALGDLTADLTVGEWVGVSGAAVSTGLGRSTSLGISLLLGFANVRLGRWWPHGVGNRGRPDIKRWLFESQRYLLDEMTAKFMGTRLRYAYLSDGGHFENTAAYEMLRPKREVKLLVVCDCGADIDYLFDDLANLVRLARIDHQLELRVNQQVFDHELLKQYFAAPEAFSRDADGNLPRPTGKCAVLLDVFTKLKDSSPGKSPDRPMLQARILVLKPVLLPNMPVDVANYAARNKAFPQESTGDQFFDEAQWESYRKLGLETVMRLFPQVCDKDKERAAAFWNAVLNLTDSGAEGSCAIGTQ